MEFIERDAIDFTIKHTDISIEIDDDIKAHLLIEVDGNDISLLYEECERISTVMHKFDCGDILLADSTIEKDRLWKLRKSISEAVKSNSIYKEEDTAVPRAGIT